MSKIKFTSGTIEKTTTDFYTMTLSNGGKVVYKATICAEDAPAIINKHGKIVKLVK